ncbi:MAG: tRNA (N(6)-L-threonylcarbamoyladenosine(37)-C(2))-methylthiotransferase MtaB [Alphaproteobacteria bacterium 16-39-46]|nr:MAG: tRNA (N(6)-L-threonylcarbamoyladenosine(37)-C(2))-methylthiotransferase MtaB [Alphaproteobacteria bacterium 16-39-46]OZA43875.1 MAG: tRNA (N(6)-L-threonylcarbamoyladenosine(37)-C(2))-methylthiotransferase MtaB [Alphaproteobacteria bacterium 17-39-52]HQS84658.1 tRNA (N(6)-L-threonylcarbamoyladenosine(37)-C(2))-methylthiotransferase MtaB [Alphaproteobacteria bacterium]HQS94484.1 tRNA (N(6)-L-threonylcarbamoyladenosine(37)-C(2))-methylthiotransferase MtaB [Alphaproteobacteria bacterium]
MSRPLEVVTFGCRLNTYESEVIRKHADSAQLTNTVIINTCAVTKEAERQSLQLIRKLAREEPSTSVIVTGCAAQINPKTFSAFSNVNLVLGNLEKLNPDIFQRFLKDNEINSAQKIQVGDIFQSKVPHTPLISTYKGLARAFVEIQNGCDHRCTFCTIPFGRGNSRSVPLGEIAHQIKHLLEKGYQEIVLTGVDITSYGQDLPGRPTLGQALKRLFKLLPSLPRLRLSSLDPVEIDEDLYRLFETEPRLMPHIHLSIQAGDTLILKRMKRRHVREDVFKTCLRLKALRPNVVFGADFIAGFPTETEDMFNNTLRLVEDLNLIYLHVFPYSPRPGTPAARMPQVERFIVKERAKRLRDLGTHQHHRYLSELQGKELDILVESSDRGRTEGYASVEIPLGSAPFGSIVKAVLKDILPSPLRVRGDVISPPLFPNLPSLSFLPSEETAHA